jgi:flagellar basal-body rod protein FlgB
MFQNLEMFKTAMSMARHAGFKQALTSQNVANADTPRYKARGVGEFADLVRPGGSGLDLKTTRSNHLGPTGASRSTEVTQGGSGEPNGNSVDLETEILNSVDAKRQHDRALAVYQASLGMLRSTLSKQ